MKIALGADHGGYQVRESVKASLLRRGTQVEDLGCHDTESVDYPDYAREVAVRVAAGTADQGILVCTTGIGMSMAANKFTGIRAALCGTPELAATARTHNHANILVLGSVTVSPEDIEPILDAWFDNSPVMGNRHERRVGKISQYAWEHFACGDGCAAPDREICGAARDEEARQQDTINLIASENHASRAVRATQASAFMNKYAEGYPGHRWYNGCRNVDVVETLAVQRARELFGADHANVQPHSGSAANMAAYFTLLKPGDTILAMRLDHGGHLTHGNPINFSGRLFNIVSYGVDPDTECIDYDAVAEAARRHRPGLILAGASAYPRVIDFPRFREIADSVGACFMVDMAHIAGLVAAGVHPSPVPHAHFVTGTTHKTLRGPRGGLVLCKEEFGPDLDKQVFPGLQGGPEMHTIAAKAVCFAEAMQPSFREHGGQTVRNARALADTLAGAGFRLVSGGTDNHLMLVDLSATGMTGKDAAAALEEAGIVANKNVIPFDKASPFVTSGVRFGTPSVTTRGMREPEMEAIGHTIAEVLLGADRGKALRDARERVRDLTARFPVPCR